MCFHHDLIGFKQTVVAPSVPSITTLQGVGSRIAEKLNKLGIRTVQDLLFHFPIRYQDRTRIWPIGSLRPGDESLIEAEVLHCEIVHRKRRMLLVDISDGTGRLLLRFFHSNPRKYEVFCLKKAMEHLRRAVLVQLDNDGKMKKRVYYPKIEKIPFDFRFFLGSPFSPSLINLMIVLISFTILFFSRDSV